MFIQYEINNFILYIWLTVYLHNFFYIYTHFYYFVPKIGYFATNQYHKRHAYFHNTRTNLFFLQ